MNSSERKHKIDLETLIIIITISIMESIGAIIFISAITRIDFLQAGFVSVLGMFVGMSGIIFAILMIFNTK